MNIATLANVNRKKFCKSSRGPLGGTGERERANIHLMTQLDTNTPAVKRFNLYLPPGLWRRLERFIQRRSRETEANITPNAEIRRAIEKHLDAEDKSNGKRA